MCAVLPRGRERTHIYVCNNLDEHRRANDTVGNQKRNFLYIDNTFMNEYNRSDIVCA